MVARVSSFSSDGSVSPTSSEGVSPKDADFLQKLSEDPVVVTAKQVVSAVKAIVETAATDKIDASEVRHLAAIAFEVAEESQRQVWASRRRSKSRQSLKEFATLLGEEAQEKAEEYKQMAEEYKQQAQEFVEEVAQEGIKYAERTIRKARSMIEDHFLIDEAFRLLGPLQQDPNFARDVHDWFNLVALVPVILFLFLNVNCVTFFCGIPAGNAALASIWTGLFWEPFWWTTFTYFVIDLLFVVSLPNCVRSPHVIIGHHVSTILYIMVPKRQPQFAWLMGACMTVEVNTWFLIARRTLNKRGESPFSPGVGLWKSLRLSIVSTCFYVSWIVIRVLFYPYLLFQIVSEWYKHWGDVGTPFNSILITPIIQSVLICLNFKWTLDLVRSKLKGRSSKSKGL